MVQSDSLTSTVFHENIDVNEARLETDNNQQIEKQISSSETNKLLLNSSIVSTINSKSPYWMVTDRQSEWYKLSIPDNQALLKKKNLIVPCKILSNIFKTTQINSNNNDRIDRPRYT